MPMGYPSHRWLGLLIAFAFQICNINSFNTGQSGSLPIIRLYATTSNDDEDNNNNCEEAVISTVKIDDGGSDLTDRFKYKVQALMGTYDPVGIDDDKQSANIVGALLQFPTSYTFTVVGKNSEEDNGDEYASNVRSKLESVLGNDAQIEMRVVPRGSKFTKVTIKVDVESQGMITKIYDELDSLDATVMKF